MQDGDIAISIRDLSKAYTIAHNAPKHTTMGEALVHRLRHPLFRPSRETFWALKDISFDVNRGEVIGIIGRNGAGKSTLLKILSRITDPTAGRVEIFGRVGSLLEVGTGFHPELTGRENIYLNGQVLGMRRKEIDHQFDAIVEFAEIEKFLDTPVKRYSSGMYVRLAFAVAAHLDPEILVVDEVLAVGDAEFQKKCLARMGELVGKQGRTILFVSHNMGSMRSLCQRLVWLDKGEIKMMGPTREVAESYTRAAETGSRGRVELAKLPRPQWLGQRMRIMSVELNGGGAVFHGDELRAEFEFEALANLEGVSIGMGISTLEGARIMTIDSDLAGVRHSLACGKRVTARFSIDQLYLQPGTYLLDIGGRSGDGYAVDYLPGCAAIEVLPGMDTPAMLGREGGGIRLPARWEWRDQDPSQALSVAGQNLSK